MMAIIVTRRTREIGIRVTLGATSRRVIGTIVGRAAWQVGLGGVLGVVPAVVVLLVVAGLTATYVPLRRALRVQLSEALRAE